MSRASGASAVPSVRAPSLSGSVLERAGMLRDRRQELQRQLEQVEQLVRVKVRLGLGLAQVRVRPEPEPEPEPLTLTLTLNPNPNQVEQLLRATVPSTQRSILLESAAKPTEGNSLSRAQPTNGPSRAVARGAAPPPPDTPPLGFGPG